MVLIRRNTAASLPAELIRKNMKQTVIRFILLMFIGNLLVL